MASAVTLCILDMWEAASPPVRPALSMVKVQSFRGQQKRVSIFLGIEASELVPDSALLSDLAGLALATLVLAAGELAILGFDLTVPGLVGVFWPEAGGFGLEAKFFPLSLATPAATVG